MTCGENTSLIRVRICSLITFFHPNFMPTILTAFSTTIKDRRRRRILSDF